MPILSEDIKLLKSQNMDDTPEGGGAMTGVEVVDGVSNNIFPDTSTDDRAAGRVNLRKVFGVAHTDDTDTLLGASFVILAPPEDPLVHCTLFETPGWADTRDTARELIERFLAKGPQLGCRLFDAHYAGSTLLRFYNVKPGTGFPSPGDAICLRNPNGTEQYVRVIKVTLGSATYTVASGAGAVQIEVNLADCEISQALAIDFIGPPVSQTVSVSSFAVAYSTAQAGGAKFYGVKPLAAPVLTGDRSVVAAGGIYSPLVPAATLEEPIVDVYPLGKRQTLSYTSLNDVVLPGVLVHLFAGAILRLPTAAEPASVSISHGGTLFTSNAAGDLLQGATVVGQVDFKFGVVTMNTTAPDYGSNTSVITYKPATRTGATAHSSEVVITSANQGLSWVFAFEPPPAPGSLSISYMAQDRWYELLEDGSGKLSGADTSHGTGTLNFVSGSVAFTAGALPDVNSSIIFTWGDANTAKKFDAGESALPTQAYCLVDLPTQPIAGSLSIDWLAGGIAKNATVDAAGVVTGPATVGEIERKPGGGYRFRFAPTLLPDADITVAYETAAEVASFTNDGGGAYTLSAAPIAPGSARFEIVAVATGLPSLVLPCYSRGTTLYCSVDGDEQVIGTVNNTTGAMNVSTPTVLLYAYALVTEANPYPSGPNSSPVLQTRQRLSTVYTLQRDTILTIGYLPTVTSGATPEEVTPSWLIDVVPPIGLQLSPTGMVFTWGSDVHWTKDGVLYRGWNALLGTGAVVGSVSADGHVTIASVPSGNSNALGFGNMALDASYGLAIYAGVFRTDVSPLKAGSFQLQADTVVGNADSGGVISGDFEGQVDSQRGIVRWIVAGAELGVPIDAGLLTYNTVYLQYLPLDGALLGLETARLPLDGKVPIYRAGGQVLVHNTLTTDLPNPLVKDTAYSLGRQRIANVVVRGFDGVKISSALYTMDFDLGEITFPLASDLTGLVQPFKVYHRIEDELMVLRADISGRLDLIAGLTHDYPADTSYVSSKLRKGDLFGRTFNYVEQSAWTSVWSDDLIGSAPTASFNAIDFPIAVTNRGAITERWAVIFSGTTLVRVVGEAVGQVLTNVSITGDIEAINPQTSVPYFSIPALAWGGGWSVGNVLRFNTAAAGGPAWAARTILQGPPTVASDKFTLAFRSDVDA